VPWKLQNIAEKYGKWKKKWKHNHELEDRILLRQSFLFLACHIDILSFYLLKIKRFYQEFVGYEIIIPNHLGKVIGSFLES
jgi:hypothetical protein